MSTIATSKNAPESIDPHQFVASVEHDTRRRDAETMLEIMSRLTGHAPKMWGPTMVGFGRYHYVYESGREGDWMVVGFSPRKAYLVVYLMTGYEDMTDHLARLGKHKLGKSCLYIKDLADVDQTVLEEMISISVEEMRNTYDTFDE